MLGSNEGDVYGAWSLQSTAQMQGRVCYVRLTDVDELDTVGCYRGEGRGHVLQVLVLIRRPLDPRGPQRPLLQDLNEGTEARAVAEIRRQVSNLEPHSAQMLVDPVAEGVGLYLYPQVLAALDGHPLRGMALGAAGHQPYLRDAQLLGRCHLSRPHYAQLPTEDRTEARPAHGLRNDPNPPAGGSTCLSTVKVGPMHTRKLTLLFFVKPSLRYVVVYLRIYRKTLFNQTFA